MNNKQLELDKNRQKALICLLVFAFGFIICLICEIALPQHANIFQFFKYVFEAGIVGGLADWFAVVALFKHPLGIKRIPHTAIIPNNQERIAKNLGVFIKQEFLSKEALSNSNFIKDIKIEKLIGDFLSGKIDSFNFDTSFDKISNNTLPKLYDFLKNNENFSQALRIDNIDFAKLLSNGFVAVRQSDLYDNIVDNLLDTAIHLIDSNEEIIKQKLVDGTIAKLTSLITHYDDKVIKGIKAYIKELKNNDENRKEILERIDSYIYSLLDSKEKRDAINQKILKFIDSTTIKNIITAVVEHIEGNKELPKLIKEHVFNIITNFIQNESRMNALNCYLHSRIIDILNTYSQKIADYIESTITKWDSKDVTKKLELEIGKDLQYIRINGTIVGSLIGFVFGLINVLIAIFFT